MNKNNKAIKRPIHWMMFYSSLGLLLVVFLIVTLLSTLLVHELTHNRNENDLKSVIEYVESKVDIEDLKDCIESGEKTEKYNVHKDNLSDIINYFPVDYLYIVDLRSGNMKNIISVMSEEERTRGKKDVEFLEIIDAYSEKELARYNEAWNKDGVSYFEESTADDGYFTACKALKATDGTTIALICVDVDTASIHSSIFRIVAIISIATLLSCGVYAFVLFILLRTNVTKPIIALEKSVYDYSKDSKEQNIILDANYIAPVINTKNEVESLANAIKKMTEELKQKTEANIIANEKVNALESISTLLDNMPALAYYKDINNGKYIMCNQSFGEFCNIKKIEDIRGLTDFDIFDEKTAEHFVEDDKKASELSKPYSFFEEVTDAIGNTHHFQTTKVKFVDPFGRNCILGMSVDISEVIEARKESAEAKVAYEEAKEEVITYSRIASALSLDYIYLYYIDITNDDFIEYHSSQTNDNLALERFGKNFFTESAKDAMNRIHKDDLQIFLSTFTKDNVLMNIEKFGIFTINYRLLIDDKPIYVNMKASRLNDDNNHIIIGVSNIDMQMKEQEALKRIHEEQLAYERINALSGDYICIYTINLANDEYIEYSSTHDYEGLGLEKSGRDFFSKARVDSVRALYYEDVDKFNMMVSKENILKTIKEEGIFVFNYRLMINNVPTYVSLKANIINENDNEELIVGVINIDAQVKREQEYESNLYVARMQADIDALTGIKNKHAYIDLEEELNHKIEEKEKVEFAIIICDVNGLKVVNDTSGHVAGDEYIRRACGLICDVFKHSPVFRVGGDEFVVVAQGSDYENVEALTRKIRECNIRNDQNNELILACGYAKYNKEKNVSLVFSRADHEMYKNKREIKDEVR